MNQFTIRDIENLSGIKAHTLRIWEQRYNFMTPKRKVSNHRFYDNDDLKHILRISYLYHSGRKISNIALMADNEINEIISRENAISSDEFLISQLMEASIDFDEHKFETVLNTSFSKNTVENAILNVVYPYQKKIGLLWVTEHIIPAQEHFSSNIINRKLLVEIDSLTIAPKPNGRRIILFTPLNEHHEIPILFIQYLLKKNGHTVIYFGDSIPVEDIEEYCTNKSADELHFHLIINLSGLSVNDYVTILSNKFPNKKIVISGPVAKEMTIIKPNIIPLCSMHQLLEYVND